LIHQGESQHVSKIIRPLVRAARSAAVGHLSQAQILIGQTAGFTGPVGAGVKETTDGAKLYIDAVNAKGGVNGEKIEVSRSTTSSSPSSRRERPQAGRRAERARAVPQPRHAAHEAIIPWLDKHGVPLIGPSTGAMVLHQPLRSTCSTCAPPTSAKPKRR
jgi:branched-chain amino acid transport system substrate-binding protein